MDDDYRPPWLELTDPTPPGTPDDGPSLLDNIQAGLQMDGEWTVREPRSLTWWGEPLPLRFTASEPRVTLGDPTIKLTAAVTILTDVSATSTDALALVDQMNRIASFGALVWLEEERRIDAFLTHYNYNGIEPITRAMTAYALVLYGEAAGRAQALADSLGGTPGVIPHPLSGVRHDWDELTTFTESHIRPAGEQPNRWGSGPFGSLSEHLTDDGFGISTAGPDGLTVEFPLARNDVERYVRLRSHITGGGDFGDDPIAPFFSMPTALGRLMCTDHPIYNAGVLSLLRFPVRARGDAIGFANDVNIGEYRGLTGLPSFGAWCSDGGGIAHSCFVPNYLYADWVLPQLAYWSAARTRWAFEAFAPDRLEQRG